MHSKALPSPVCGASAIHSPPPKDRTADAQQRVITADESLSDDADSVVVESRHIH